MGNLAKYLVRPIDHQIFVEGSDGRYRPWFKSNQGLSGGRGHAKATLVNNFGFFEDIEENAGLHIHINDTYAAFRSWKTRPDGHGGVKGGTWEEFMEYQDRVEKYQAALAEEQ